MHRTRRPSPAPAAQTGEDCWTATTKHRTGRVVGMAGLEPARPCGRGILSPLRLPFRHIPDDFTTLNSKYLRHVSSCRLAAITVTDNERGRNERKPFRAQKRPWQSQRSTLRTGLRWTQVARSRSLEERRGLLCPIFSLRPHQTRPGYLPQSGRRDDGPCRQGRTSKPQNRSQQAEHPTDGRCPSFAEIGARYLSEVSSTKRPATFRKERAHIAWWTARLRALPLPQIHRTHVNAGIAYGFGVP